MEMMKYSRIDARPFVDWHDRTLGFPCGSIDRQPPVYILLNHSTAIKAHAKQRYTRRYQCLPGWSIEQLANDLRCGGFGLASPNPIDHTGVAARPNHVSCSIDIRVAARAVYVLLVGHRRWKPRYQRTSP